MQYVATCCNVCVVVRCSALQCVAVLPYCRADIILCFESVLVLLFIISVFETIVCLKPIFVKRMGELIVNGGWRQKRWVS